MNTASTGHLRHEGTAAAVLLAEDDGPSCHFLEAALKSLGWHVDACTDGAAALALAQRRRFDLLLLDCRMPGAGALRILASLRADPQAASHASAAIATSAELNATLRAQLHAAGFADALAKPLSLPVLQAAVQALLPASSATVPMLDDATALLSSGNRETVDALRSLFEDELRNLQCELDAPVRQPRELSERLHRLLASCGFCGAGALAEAARHLKRQLDTGTPVCDATALATFRQCLAATLDALTAAPKP